jgi:fluoride exporter
MQWFWIGLGGALGSMLRYSVQARMQTAVAGFFPWGTLSVNLIGSALIGILGGWFLAAPFSHNLRLFLMVGILGGFTTFSSFSLDVLTLLREGHARVALLYVLASNIAGLGLAFGGFLAARALIGRSVAGP